jgi:hypothetical protein
MLRLPFGVCSSAMLGSRECSILLTYCSKFFDSSEFQSLCVLLPVSLELLHSFRGVTFDSPAELGYSVVKGAEYFVSL